MTFGTGPVFAYERLTASRRWQNYGLRAFGVAALLVAMGTIASSRDAFFEGSSVNTLEDYAQLGQAYVYAIIMVELVLVMLVAPAATAGAICLDRSRGTLEHMLATDLSDVEIVLDKLAARLMPVFGLIAASMPVLALSTLLGGVDLLALAGGFLVVVSVAVFGCSLALALSVWARKPYEVVLAMYTVWAIIMLGPLLWARLAEDSRLAIRRRAAGMDRPGQPVHRGLRALHRSRRVGAHDLPGLLRRAALGALAALRPPDDLEDSSGLDPGPWPGRCHIHAQAKRHHPDRPPPARTVARS